LWKWHRTGRRDAETAIVATAYIEKWRLAGIEAHDGAHFTGLRRQAATASAAAPGVYI